VVVRSAEFANLQGEVATAFAELGIRTVYDLRTEAERAAQPNVVPSGVEYVVLDILKDSSSSVAAQLIEVVGDPKAAGAMLVGGKGGSAV
jgi:protein-tyrosine phosphatase